MKYFVIAGEASGDLHASGLLKALKRRDHDAEFMGLGGDMMEDAGCKLVKHYRDMAYMGFIAVATHLGKILQNMKDCKNAISEFKPDIVILVDYPSFNLKIAEFVKKTLPGTPVHYYIAPKLWAWKEYRLKSIKKYVDRVYSILPFEIEWFGKRGYKVDYVGNPCADAVYNRPDKEESFESFCTSQYLDDKPIIALLAGSRVQEIRSSLPKMLEATKNIEGYQLVIAGAPSIYDKLYDEIIATSGADAKVVHDATYRLLAQSKAAVVCSGTATLETALIGTPQTVVYHIGGGKWVHRFLNIFIHVDQVSLVNLIANRKMVKELIIENFTPEKVEAEVRRLLTDEAQQQMKNDYMELRRIVGDAGVGDRAAEMIIDAVNTRCSE
ncbi:MAG: lipid-A-disaccharide synthase [Paludibacteraceae bacterium]|nr:lipid-A-disaccharide synthase [Paludibacteraceae bacterium]